MTDPLVWFIEKILPYLTIAVISGAFVVYRKVDKLHHDLAVLTKDCHQLATAVESKWKDMDTRVRDDIVELREQIDYMTRNHISRDELNQYLSQLNTTVSRLAETLDKFI